MPSRLESPLLPETITVRSEQLVAALGLLDAFSDICTQLGGRHREDFDWIYDEIPFLLEAAGLPSDDGTSDAVAGVVWDAQRRFEPRIRELLGRDGDPIGELRHQLRLLSENVIGVTWDDGWRPLRETRAA